MSRIPEYSRRRLLKSLAQVRSVPLDVTVDRLSKQRLLVSECRIEARSVDAHGMSEEAIVGNLASSRTTETSTWAGSRGSSESW